MLYEVDARNVARGEKRTTSIFLIEFVLTKNQMSIYFVVFEQHYGVLASERVKFKMRLYALARRQQRTYTHRALDLSCKLSRP